MIRQIEEVEVANDVEFIPHRNVRLTADIYLVIYPTGLKNE